MVPVQRISSSASTTTGFSKCCLILSANGKTMQTDEGSGVCKHNISWCPSEKHNKVENKAIIRKQGNILRKMLKQKIQ